MIFIEDDGDLRSEIICCWESIQKILSHKESLIVVKTIMIDVQCIRHDPLVVKSGVYQINR
jgi:hypothetical protein